MKPTLAIKGAAGRMGKRIIALAVEADYFRLTAAVDAPNHPELGKDAGLLAGIPPLSVPLTDALPDNVSVVIDFSLPQAAKQTIEHCKHHHIPLVLGTTGLSADDLTALQTAAQSIPIVQATNMSLGMNLLFALVGKVAAALGEDYDIEIVEAHHRFKKDAPSGSALTLAESICKKTSRKYPDCIQHGREGKECLRQKGQIGMHALRAGDIVGQHSVIYSTIGETITLSHSAHSRDTFARGALRAAQWVLAQTKGLFSMQDVLGLST